MLLEDFEWGFEGECQGCDNYLSLNDLGLCDDCAAKLDRDLIRQREWDYSSLAFGVPVEQREALRRHIIREYGESYELLAPPPSATQKKQQARKKKKRK